jgi:hypothetical protein
MRPATVRLRYGRQTLTCFHGEIVTEPRTPTSMRSLLALLLLAAAPPATLAQDSRIPTVEEVRVGLPYRSGDPDSGHSRRGAWVPVYVKLKAGSQGIAPGTHRLVVEANDSEDAAYEFFTPLPSIEPEKDCFAITYARPGSSDINISLQTMAGKPVPVQVRTPDGRTAVMSRIQREFSRGELPPSDILYLAIGSRLPGLHRALMDNAPPELADENLPEDHSTRKLSYIDSARDLPDRWYGYDAVDIVVLTTASDTFVREFLEDKAARTALGEWVRRGGKLIVAAGRNRQLVADLLEKLPLSESDKQPLINCNIDGAIAPKGQRAVPLQVMSRWATFGREPPPVLEVAELTRLVPNALPDPGPNPEPVNALIREAAAAGEREGPPVVVHAGCGMGRVVLLAIDPETAPFNSWPGQKAFWEKLENELEPRTTTKHEVPGGFGMTETDLGGELKRALESFQEVPVISFGWVALFILVYIFIVGPLDYLILKKVFKRLELTWITFPTVVLVISVAAYFTAYSLKGNDLRINKIDVIDLDLHGRTPQAYGSSWVTLFSPRIQNYTIGIEPAAPPASQEGAPAWVGPASTDPRAPRPLVTVMEGGETMSGRIGSQGLFRRTYEYAPEGAGLVNVSIPVWSMRSFTARWRTPLTPTRTPIELELRHSRDKNDPSLVGRVTSHLPVELTNVTLLYKGRSYAVGSVAPDTAVPIDNLKIGEQGKQASQWFLEGADLASASKRTVTTPTLIRDMLFHGPPAQTDKSNGDWRCLDQSWRLRPLTEYSTRPQPQSVYCDEVVLIARVPSRADRSETVTAADASPTRLWIDALPGTGAERPPLNGFLVQDVYIRAYGPVTP